MQEEFFKKLAYSEEARKIMEEVKRELNKTPSGKFRAL